MTNPDTEPTGSIAHLPALYVDWLIDPGASVPAHCSGTGTGTLSVVRVDQLLGNPVPGAYRETPLTGTTPVTLQPRSVPKGSSAVARVGPRARAAAAWRWTLSLFPTLTDRGEVT